MNGADLGGFGDERRRKVGAALLAVMQQSPTMCLHSLAKDRNQALQFGRFLDNDAVSAHEMLVQAGRLTGQRVAGRHVLAIQDTTELHFATHRASKRSFGLAGDGQDIGLFLHPVVVMDAEHGGLIGLAGATVINRTSGPAGARQQRAPDEKESRRWLTGAETAGEVLVAAARITVVCDREGDIYDMFARRPGNTDLLVRAAQDRLLACGDKLFAHCAAWPERDRAEVEVSPKGRRARRRACVGLRFGCVMLKRPRNGPRSESATVMLHVVDIAEIDPPAGEEPLHWCLLTTHAVTSVAEARQCLAWYRCRWVIEQVFRTLKTDGVAIETSQMIEATGFVKLAVAALIAALRVMQIVLGRDGSTGQPLSDVADEADAPALQASNRSLEGRTDKLKNPHEPRSLAWFTWIVARLGGWSGYSSRGYKPPGPKTVFRGLLRLDGIISGWNLADRSGLMRLP